MRKRYKYLIAILVVLLVFGISGYSAFIIMNSRTFQLFGELTPRVETTQKVVALTFDDAPNTYTRDVLATLQQKQVKATFYEIGQQIEKYPEIARAITEAGMEPGNHTYTHQRMVLHWPSFYEEEVERTN